MPSTRYAVLRGKAGHLVMDPRKPNTVVAYAGMRMKQFKEGEEPPDSFADRFEPIPQLFKYTYDLQRLVAKKSLELVGEPFVASAPKEAMAKMTEIISEGSKHGPDWD